MSRSSATAARTAKVSIHKAINLAISSLWLVGDNLGVGFSTGFNVCTSLMIGQKLVKSRKSQIICSEHSLIKSVTCLCSSLFIAGTLPVYGLQTTHESSSLIAKSSNNMDSDVFESEQMIKEEPRIEPQPPTEPQTQPQSSVAQQDEMRYEKPVEQIDPPWQDAQPVMSRTSKRAKANSEIREVAPEGRSLGQTFESMKKKVKQKRGRKVAEEEMPPVAPRIVPNNTVQTQTKKTDPQEEALQKLVRELEFGTLDKSIKVLRELIATYPEDSDYKKLLDMANSLKEADTWYSYQRNTPSPSMNQDDEEKPKAQPKPLPQIQASSDNPRVNELKRSSWLLIKNNYHRN